ncbi:biopolymer transporter ExbD [soil metagenome]
MAEIQTSETRKSKGVRRSKKLSTKVDLTPMVDLGFLLINFFVFTTSITKPTAMKLNLPDDPDSNPATAAEGKTLSILLGANNIIYYYEGQNIANMHISNFSSVGLRKVIRNKKQLVRTKYGDGNETVVLIKPTTEASYSNVIDALDEIQINTIGRFVLMDANEEESALLFKH